MQLALAAGGAFVGSFFGPIGAQIGWTAGAILGGLLNPQRTQGPKLSDLHVQGSSYGAPVPFIWPGEGIRVGGNVVWKTELVEHEHTSSAKGGPTITTSTYTVSFRVSFGKTFGDDVSIGRVWKNNRLVDDFRQGSTVTDHLPIVFYDGNENQLPDPTEEAILGVGMAPAYRGVASVVFTDVAVESNVIDQYNFELIAGAGHIDKAMETVTLNDNDGSPAAHVWPWYSGGGASIDGNAPAITAWPENGVDPIRVRDVVNSNVYTYDSVTLAYIGSDTGADQFPAFFLATTAYFGIGNYRYSDSDVRVQLWGSGRLLRIDETEPSGGVWTGPPISSIQPVVDPDEATNTLGSNFLASSGIPSDEAVAGCVVSQDERMAFVMTVTPAQYAIDAGATIDRWHKVINGIVTDSGDIPGWPDNAGQASTMFGSTTRAGNTCGMFENDYKTCWISFGNAPGFQVWKINDANEFVRATEHNTAAPGGNLQQPGGGGIHNLAIYALASGCKCGLVAGNSASTSMWLAERCTFTPGNLQLADIADDVCDESDMADEERNVDAIPIPVRAFMVDSPPTTGRTILETLLPVYFVDALDRDGVATFIPRGRAPDVTVPSGDHIVRSEGETLAPRLKTVTGNHKELPRHVVLSYINPAADYLTGTQQWQRMTGGSKDVREVRVPVSLSDAEAKRVVDMWGETAWTEADKHSFSVTRKYLKYEGADVMIVEGVPIRVQTKKEGIRGALEFEGVRNDPGLIAQAGIPGDSGGGFVPPEIPVPQDTELAMIDGPFIGSDPREGLIPAAFQGALRRSWRGAELDKSLDGTNYTPLLTETVAGTIGITQTALGNYGGVAFDEQNVVRVLFPSGAAVPSSVTRDAAFAGENTALIGTEEQGVRGELVNFKNCDLVSSDESGSVCDISGFLRGRRGSRPFMAGHAVGEKFIVLPTASSVALVNSDLSIARNYKAVTIGRTLATADVYPFKSHGLPYAAFQPRFVRMGFMGAPGSSDILIEWNRSSRVARGWLNFRSPTGLGPPLGEEDEKYRLRIFEDGTKQTVLSYRVAQVDPLNALTATQYKYTTAQQTEDFGAPLEVLPVLNVAQKCAIGWGWDSDGGVPIFVPGDLPNYIPPYPPLDDARFVDSTIAWSEAATISSGLGPDDIWCVRINTGSTPTGAIPVLINAAEFNATPPSGRVAAISTIRGDTVGQGHAMASTHGQSSNSITFQFFVGAGAYMSAAFPTFPASSTAYLNIKTVAPNGPAVDMFATIKRIP